MSRVVFVLELFDEYGARPMSVNRHSGQYGYGRFTDEVRDWKSAVTTAVIEAVRELPAQQRTDLLGAEGERDGYALHLEWIGDNPTFGQDLDNVHKLVQDGVWAGLRWYRPDLPSDRWINLIGGEVIDRARLRPHEPDRRFLRGIAQRRRRRALNREEWDALKAAARRNELMEKLRNSSDQELPCR